ncbi:universal stress protein (plasmid) [Ruegeria sp. SCSIO 43209]|uniref:universal stress protein n=1 Tax=Ruegeria sp. SCSIO 43209 TaxID=2793010 RepID=UPI00148172CA|nr:universal stress protein [Ruegeria sp. SCSIO 43209]UAB91464.1 universal stress protein [Ruegeria sp. SCSIO 43209]
MYGNILVPVSFDTDRDAQRALDVAQTLRSDGGHITLLHVIEHLPQYTSDLLPENHLDIAKTSVTDKLGPLVDGVADSKIEIVEGQSGRGILDYATNNNADCIVIASHQPGLQDYLLGSTAARVVRHANCSVHVVR